MTRVATLLALGLFLAAAEPVPVVELSWSGTVAAYGGVAAMWERGVQEAGPWLGGDARRLAASGTGLHLRGVVLPPADGAKGSGRLAAAGRWCGAGAAAGTVAALVAGWERYGSRRDGEDLLIGDPAVAEVPSMPLPPGVRVVVQGAGLAAELIGGGPLEPAMWNLATTVLPGWSATAAVSARSGQLDTGLPAAWFAPIDTALLAELPSDMQAKIVIAPRWDALVAAVAALPEAARAAFPDDDVLLDSSAYGTGTWAAGITAEGHWLLVLPRDVAPALVEYLLPITDEVDLESEGGGPRSVGADSATPVWLERRDGAWWFGTDAAAFAVTPVAPKQALPTDATCWIKVDDRGMASALQAGGAAGPWARSLIRMLPLPVSLLWPDVGTGEPDWQALAAALSGWQHATGREAEGRLVLDLEGSVAPWLVPGVAVTWFLDRARDAVETRRLRDYITAQEAQGVPMSHAGMQRAIPAMPVQEAEAILVALSGFEKALREQLDASGMSPEDQEAANWFRWKSSATTRGLPLTPIDTGEDQALMRARLTVALARSLPRPELGWVACRFVPLPRDNPFAMMEPHLLVARHLARAGQTMLAFGEPQGSQALDLAQAMLPLEGQILMVEGLVALQVRVQAAEGRLIAVCGRVLAATHAFLQPPPPLHEPIWAGERSLLGELARWAWSDDPEWVQGLAATGEGFHRISLLAVGERGWTSWDLRRQLAGYGDEVHDVAAAPQRDRSAVGRTTGVYRELISANFYRARCAEVLAWAALEQLLGTAQPSGTTVPLSGLELPGGGILSASCARLAGGGLSMRLVMPATRPALLIEGAWNMMKRRTVPDGTVACFDLTNGIFVWDPARMPAAGPRRAAATGAAVAPDGNANGF